MLYPQSQLLLRNLSDLNGNTLLVEPMADQLLAELTDLPVSVWCTDAASAKAFAAASPLLAERFSHQGTPFDTVVIFYPKAKEQLVCLLKEIQPFITAKTDIYLTGDNKGGIKSLPTQASKLGLHAHKLDNAKHCLWFALSGLAEASLPANQFGQYPLQATVGKQQVELEFCSLPGVFNHGRLDAGTAQLLQQLDHIQHGRVLDFACGAGLIGAVLKKRHPRLDLWATDICALAIASTRATLALQNVQAELRCQAGITDDLPLFDHIVSNPPFHTGLKLDLQISQEFIRSCKQHLKPGGSLTLVANAHLPYGQWLTETFGKATELSRSNGFIVWQAWR